MTPPPQSYFMAEALVISPLAEMLRGKNKGGGKSKLGCLWLISMCQKYPDSRWLMGRSKLKALKETTLNTFFQTASELGVSNQYKYNSQTNVITWRNGSEILLKDLFLYPSDPEFDSLGSLEITGAFIDECNQCAEKAVQVVSSRIRFKLRDYCNVCGNQEKKKILKSTKIGDTVAPSKWICGNGHKTEGLLPKQLMTCNPAKNWTYSNFYNPSINGTLEPHRKFIQALPADNPYLPASYIDSLKRLDTASRKRLLEGDWNYDDNPYALFDYADILGMFTSEWIKPNNIRYMTCDIAYGGSDRFVITIWDGFVAIKIIAIEKIDDTMVSKKIQELRIEYRVPIKNVLYDSDGLATFTRYSSKFGSLSQAIGFKNNGKAIKVKGKTENYKNLKAQCYFLFAEMVKDGKIFIQDKTWYKQIVEELEQINKVPSKDEEYLAIEKKSDLKERLKRSPDFADSLMMRAYFEIKGKSKPRLLW